MKVFHNFVIPLTLSILILSACHQSDTSSTSPKDYKAQEIVDWSLEVHGSKSIVNSVISFNFRGQRFTIKQDTANYTYAREFINEGDSVFDVLNNGKFERLINGKPVQLTSDEQNDAVSDINSVPYFALLPYKLNDPAVIKEYVGETNINNQTYHKIRVTFKKEGGGKDHDNTFYYWFHKQHYTLDFLAYSKLGNRFRVAYNSRIINGIRFSDYENYKSDQLIAPDLEDYDKLFEENKLVKLSKIELTDIEVKPLTR